MFSLCLQSYIVAYKVTRMYYWMLISLFTLTSTVCPNAVKNDEVFLSKELVQLIDSDQMPSTKPLEKLTDDIGELKRRVESDEKHIEKLMKDNAKLQAENAKFYDDEKHIEKLTKTMRSCKQKTQNSMMNCRG